jgi:hypothetical protein
MKGMSIMLLMLAMMSVAAQEPMPVLRVSSVAYVGMTEFNTKTRTSIGGYALGKDKERRNMVVLFVEITNASEFPAKDVSLEYLYHHRYLGYKAGTKQYAIDRGVRERQWSTAVGKQGRLGIGNIPARSVVRVACPDAEFDWAAHSDRFSNSWGDWQSGAKFSHYVVKLYSGGRYLGAHQGNNRTHIRPASR